MLGQECQAHAAEVGGFARQLRWAGPLSSDWRHGESESDRCQAAAWGALLAAEFEEADEQDIGDQVRAAARIKLAMLCHAFDVFRWRSDRWDWLLW